jgi:N-methylhydantoinase B
VILRNGSSYVPKHLSKEQDITLAPGDRVWVRTPGGGGYGDPLQRPVDAVREDVRLERYSLTEARDLYGVVLIKNDNVLCVDEAETAKLRVEMKRSF